MNTNDVNAKATDPEPAPSHSIPGKHSTSSSSDGQLTVPAVAEDPLEKIRAALWSEGVNQGTYSTAGEKYQAALMEQYKLYVEMADRISQRRGLTNLFFLTLNSAIFTLVGVFWKDQPAAPKWALLFPTSIAVLECFAWLLLIRSYRQLNTAKYKVIGALEERLPASTFWKAEWKELGEGKTIRLCYPLSHIEGWIPGLFIVAYLVGCGLAIGCPPSH